MDIVRINTYQDTRFSQVVLNQHGCFLINDEPYEVEIISEYEAIVRGRDSNKYLKLIEEFRFYTPHITCFYDSEKNSIVEYPKKDLITIDLNRIQPSQFYVDKDKIDAIRNFITCSEDVIIQVMPYENGYISLDGHTRLYYAVMNKWKYVRAVVDSSDKWVFKFVEEAKRRGVFSPHDLILLNHDEYEVKWNVFCDSFFKEEEIDA